MIFHPGLKILGKYVDGGISEAQRLKIKSHLEKCEKCKSKIITLDALENSLALSQKPKSDFTEKILSNLLPLEKTKIYPVGEIQTILGKAFLKKGENFKEVFPGMAIFQGDTLSTETGSKILFKLNDGSSFYLNQKTEIHFPPQGMFSLSLFAGQFFAMMKPQKSSFSILTPAAILGVIGTDFDTKIQEDKKTTLTVLKGKVSIKNEIGETVVKKKHQVEAGKTSKLVSKKVIEPAPITNWTSEFIQEKRSPNIMKKLGWLLIFLIIVFICWLFYTPGDDFKFNQGINLSKNDPIHLSSPYQQQGLTWRTKMVEKVKENGEWRKSCEVTTITKVMEVGEKFSRVRFIIETVNTKGKEIKEHQIGMNSTGSGTVNKNFSSDGKVVIITDTTGKQEIQKPIPQNNSEEAVKESLIGREFEYIVPHDGGDVVLKTLDGQLLEGFEIFYTLGWGQNALFGPFQDKEDVSVGETWKPEGDFIIPANPQPEILFDEVMEFSGYEKLGKIETATFYSTTKGQIKGEFPLIKTSPAPGVSEIIFINNVDIESDTKIYLDTKTGKVFRIEQTGQSQTGNIQMKRIVSGRPAKELTVHSNNPADFKILRTFEYL